MRAAEYRAVEVAATGATSPNDEFDRKGLGAWGAAVALYFFAMYVFGGSFGPLIVGGVSDRMARRAMLDAGATAMTESFRAAGLHSAMYLVPVVLLATALVLLAGARTVGGDMERMQERLRASWQ